MKILITGITGFSGTYLAERLLEEGKGELYGTYLSDDSLERVSHLKNKVTFQKLNLTDSTSVDAFVAKIKPDHIYHLAAKTSPADSLKNPSESIITNITSQINLLESVKKADIDIKKVLIVSSADVYGIVLSEDNPVTEGTQLRPGNPYSVSKIAQDYLGLQYFLTYHLPIIRVRPFNHIGPRQDPKFVVSAFCRQIAMIEKKQQEPVLKVGNLTAKKDFTDVRDIINAYILLMEKGEEGNVYNLGSGKGYKVEELLNILLYYSSEKITVKVDQELVRPVDVPVIVCDNNRIVSTTGWEPKISIEQSLKDTLDYWRALV